MPKIKFTADPKLPRDLAHLGYKKGDIVELSEDQCERWVRRGVATLTTESPPAPEPAGPASDAPAPESPPAPEPAAAARSEAPARPRRFGRPSE